MTLAALYAQIPDVRCKGLCQRSCGPIGCSGAEAEALVNEGIALPVPIGHSKYGDLTCSHLGQDGRCAIYDKRPMICRLFGATRELRCPHGCLPDQPLTDDQARDLLRQARELSPLPPYMPSL